MSEKVFFTAQKISVHVTRIQTITEELVYLVEGEEKAAVIDTGTGIGNLKAFIRELTDKPLVVILTHGHVDHAMGAPLFEDEASIYMCHEDIVQYMEHRGLENREGYAALKGPFTQEELVPVSDLDFQDMETGDRFDLGGISLEVYRAPGHTQGSVVLLIREERTLLLGDACNSFTFLFAPNASTVAEYQKMLKELKAGTDGRYDRVYLSHGDGDAPKEMIEDVIAVCQDVLDGKADDVPFEFMGMKALIAKRMGAETFGRVDGGIGNLVYNRERIR